MRVSGARRRALTAVACVLVSAVATGCARPAIHSSGVWYTCCSQSVTSTHWRPGQQLPVVWTRTGTVPAGARFRAVTLSAVLTGPYANASALKAALKNRSGPGGGKITAAAPQLRISRNPPRSAVSVITIPPGALPGLYNLWTSVSSGAAAVTGGTIVTVG